MRTIEQAVPMRTIQTIKATVEFHTQRGIATEQVTRHYEVPRLDQAISMFQHEYRAAINITFDQLYTV